MTPKTAFTILYAAMVKQHLSAIERKHYSLLKQAIEANLLFEPEEETRNRKPLKRPLEIGAHWELRCGPNNRYRIFYRVEREQRQVVILAIGKKQDNHLFIGDEEVLT